MKLKSGGATQEVLDGLQDLHASLQGLGLQGPMHPIVLSNFLSNAATQGSATAAPVGPLGPAQKKKLLDAVDSFSGLVTKLYGQASLTEDSKALAYLAPHYQGAMIGYLAEDLLKARDLLGIPPGADSARRGPVRPVPGADDDEAFVNIINQFEGWLAIAKEEASNLWRMLIHKTDATVEECTPFLVQLKKSLLGLLGVVHGNHELYKRVLGARPGIEDGGPRITECLRSINKI